MDRDVVRMFMDRFVGYAAGAATMSTLAVADRSGLLTVMAGAGPVTCHELADRARLERRYVEEMVRQLTAAEVVVYDPVAETFELPDEHGAVIADDASPYSLAGWLDMLSSAAGFIDEIVESARHGGGVAADRFPARAVTGVARANGPSLRILLTRRWLPTMPDVVARLEAGARVADVGCGAGAAALTMAAAYPRSQVVGFDVDTRALELAVAEAGRSGLTNVRFEQRSATEIPLAPGFDLITCFDVVHDIAHASEAVARFRRALVEGGTFLMMEPAVEAALEDNIDPRAALFLGLSLMFCMTQSLAAGGEGHGAAWGQAEAERLCRDAGFGSFRRLPVENPYSAFYEVRA